VRLPWVATSATVFAMWMGLIAASASVPPRVTACTRAETNCASGQIQRLSRPSRLDYAVLASLPDSPNLLAVWASGPGQPAQR
jgi:hypothetical protein